jgi:hypothetical protein
MSAFALVVFATFLFISTTQAHAAAVLVLNAPDATITVSPLVASTNGTADNNADVDALVAAGLSPIVATLGNTGDEASQNVRIAPIGGSAHIQLWAKDTIGNWYDINVTGWGPLSGFPVAAGSEGQTEVYAVSDMPGTYTSTTNVVDASNDSVLASDEGTIEVLPIAHVHNQAELEAALANDLVTEIVVDGTIGASDDFTAYSVDRPVTINGGNSPEVYGALIIKSDGVTVHGLTMHTRGGGTGPLKAAIDVIAKNVTITNNTFDLPNALSASEVGNGVTVWPVGDAEAEYEISGNIFNGYDQDTDDWSSSALQVVEGLDLARFGMGGTVSEEVTLDPEVEKALALGNTYSNSSNNYVHSNWSSGINYRYVLASTEEQLQSLEYAGEGATVLFGDDIDTSSTVEIGTGITIDGNGHTLYPSFAKTDNSNNAGLLIIADDVDIHDLSIDGSNGTSLHGVHVYTADGVTFENVTLQNNANAGMIVNGSTVTVTDITTSANGWGGINVDQGSGVTDATSLTILGTSHHAETGPAIWKDDNAKTGVSVLDTNGQYDAVTYTHDTDIVGTQYTLKAPAPEPVEPVHHHHSSSGRSHGATEPEGQVLGAATSTASSTGTSAVAYYHFAVDFGIGSSGTDVTNLQNILIHEGLLKIDTPTGYFGPLTEAAVKLYQAAHGIPTTGFVGPLTRAQLNTVAVVVTAGEEIQQQIDALLAQVAALKAELDAMQIQ